MRAFFIFPLKTPTEQFSGNTIMMDFSRDTAQYPHAR
jgi:hypothetical protein